MKTAKLKRMVWRYGRKATKVGYKRKGYNFNKSVKNFKKTGTFKVVKDGSGHDAGYKWAAAKGIDANSKMQRYSKNSPSFDEGVYKYKQEQLSKGKMRNMVKNTKTLSFAKKGATKVAKATTKAL